MLLKNRIRVVALGTWLVFLVADEYRIRCGLPRELFGDEWRYIYYANNLLHGYFSPTDRIFLWNGPGYPLILVPFVKVDWIDGARHANAVWHSGAMAYAWLILRVRMSEWWAVGAVVLLGLYPPVNEHLPLLYTEVFCFFLVTAWIFHIMRAPQSSTHRTVAAFYFAILCLTKVVFGVVLMLFILVLSVDCLLRRTQRSWPYLLHAVLAFVLCVPYLVYTYRITGKLFYWSSAGPNTFYWLTSPYPDEWGDWYHQGWVNQNPILRAHHKALFDQTSGLAQNPDLPELEQVFNLSTPETAEIFLERGLRNIREHPLKFARNWCGNLIRLFLDVPVSVRGTPFWNEYSLSNLPLLVLTGIAVMAGWRRRLRIPPSWIPIGLFALLTIATYSFSSIVARYLIPLVPIWWLGLCCSFSMIFAAKSCMIHEPALFRSC